MNTTSVRIKFRKSSVDGKEGTLYYQVIHNRLVRQIGTEYHLFTTEWHEDDENIVLSKTANTRQTRKSSENSREMFSKHLRLLRRDGEVMKVYEKQRNKSLIQRFC